MFCHPHLMLQRKHKRILLSTATNPKGKLTKTFKIKPPKLLSTKWIFQEELAKQGLTTIIASACNFRYPDLGCCNENLLITCYYLNPEFYKDSTWAQYSTNAYKPYAAVANNMTFKYDEGTTEKTFTYNLESTYDKSVSYSTGWFQTKIT